MADSRLDAELVEAAAHYSRNPLGFVLYAFPWGGPELDGEDGPDQWQREVLEEIGAALREGLITVEQVLQIAVASGHGVGKSALVAWVILWALCTMEDTRGVVTANTESQLKSKTWAELGKWHRLCAFSGWFELTATSIYSTARERTWRIDALAWSEKRPEAFAGLHNAGKRLLVVFDEASAIPDVIWETTEGALTDANTQILWLAFGNPTRSVGRFAGCWGKFRSMWKRWQVDSRTAKRSNKAKLAQWIELYGEDHDFVRVRVLGVFPRASDVQFIGSDLVDAAAKREAICHPDEPVAWGLDVARGGAAQSVLAKRRGRDARSQKWLKARERDTMKLAAMVQREYHEAEALGHAPDAIFVDEGGVGGGVLDRLLQLGLPVIGVSFGGSADGASLASLRAPPEKYANKRAEMWGAVRWWLRTGAIPADDGLQADLVGPEFYHDRRDAIVLESKEDMLARDVASPDEGDALALTFAFPVTKRSPARQQSRRQAYDPLATV